MPTTVVMEHVDVMEMRDGKIVGGQTYNSFARAHGDVVGHVASDDERPTEYIEHYANFSDGRLKRAVAPVTQALTRLQELSSDR